MDRTDTQTAKAPPPNPTEEEESKEVDLEKEARGILLAKMVRAKKAGNEAKAEHYSKMYKAILADQKPKASKVAVDNEVQVSFTTPVIPQKRPMVLAETTQVRNVKFIVGRSNSHDNKSFTPYFHKLILECKGPLPLTIFNREWQEQALSYHSKNRPKTDETAAEKGLPYHGYPVPDEFSQNFSEWTLNYRSFYLTMRDRYNYPVLAEWILAHKEHCNWLHQTRGFMVALRYDIWIRNNTFTFRVEEDGEESFSDISKFNQEHADEAISTCRDFNEIRLPDNPFKGIKPLKTKQVNHIPQPFQPKPKASHKELLVKPLSQVQGHSSLPATPDQSQGPRGSGYKGNNFNPNHTGGSVRNRNREQ
ncbi:hypothetical protein PTTG_06453 [Puccinia triticina 1-1 BBBD Race 1]|uniref:Uncharacterized protein n=1 Tax=Puccinia triticina (isolate 1-1 / race 1 (BBBD)) TaxID=630390 RepID=A0A180GW51_PUCT1|nr:hypothetical protein PTTG_06453 [Puccinia triticina 1-1 BBBD Race 1]